MNQDHIIHISLSVKVLVSNNNYNYILHTSLSNVGVRELTLMISIQALYNYQTLNLLTYCQDKN